MIKDGDGRAQKPEFFKVLMPGFEEELGIPPAFAKYVIDLRGKKATLISPLGNSWPVNIHGHNRNLYFREGWPELAQAHDLKMGYFMVFSYEGDRTFSFQVFDTSACKKNYSSVGAHGVEFIDIKQELSSAIDSEGSIQRLTRQASRRDMRMMNGGEPSIKRKRKPSCSSTREPFVAIMTRSNVTRNYMGIPASFRASNDIGTRHEVILNDMEGRSWPVRIRNRGPNSVCLAQGWKEFCADKRLEEGDRCIFELASMKGDNLSVRIVKRSTGMEQRCSWCMNWEEHCYWDHFETRRFHFLQVMDGDFSQHMIIPKKFVKNFNRLSENILLKGPSGNIWHVKLSKYKEDMTFKNGWKQFVEAHYIKEDDHLVFKYNDNSCFSVLIFDQTGCEKEACYFVKGPKDKVKVSCQSEEENAGDSFEILHDSVPPKAHNHGSSKIPSNFRQKVQHPLATHKRKANFPSNLMNEREQIVKPTKVKRQRIKKELQFNLRSLGTEEGKAQAQLKARSFRPANPFFLKVMEPNHLCKKVFLGIPKYFSAEHFPREKQTIVLRLPHGKKIWRVNYLFYNRGSGFGGQWNKFAVDNNLEEGDVCIFELTGELLIDVHIFRGVNNATQPCRGLIEK